jgi:hypothetical protein
LFDPLDGLEHILNAFFAALTGEPLIADDFESDGLKHRFCVTPRWHGTFWRFASKGLWYF